MCFSPEASFSVAVFLTIVGYGSIRQAKRPELKYLALIPWFFAVQQASEGMLWLSLMWENYPSVSGLTAQYFFLFFALIVYPVWFPLALSAIEKDGFRKNIMFTSLGFGLYIAAYDAYYILLEETSARIVDFSIQYYQGTLVGKIFYSIPIFLSIFFSSLKGMWIFGLLTLISFVISLFIYLETFTSVWCFFTAIVSILIFWILRKN